MKGAPGSLLKIATPSEDDLLHWVQARVGRPLLAEISANDRGEDITKHLAGIQAQLRPNPPFGLLPWWPREVLELERWSNPDRAYLDSAPDGERGHLKRLLACLILLRNGAHLSEAHRHSEEEFFLQTSSASLVRFTGSALALKTTG